MKRKISFSYNTQDRKTLVLILCLFMVIMTSYELIKKMNVIFVMFEHAGIQHNSSLSDLMFLKKQNKTTSPLENVTLENMSDSHPVFTLIHNLF